MGEEETPVIQSVKASDMFESQLFQWDTERRIISLPHGKDIWFAKLGDDGKFTILESQPKPQRIPKKDK
jgi:hypothetical protein